MNDQLLAALIAAIIGLITNVVIKKLEKYKSKEEKDQVTVETAEKSLEIMKQTLEVLEKRNKTLEEMLETEFENKEIINNLYGILYDILQDEAIIIPDSKRQEIINCIERRKDVH